MLLVRTQGHFKERKWSFTGYLFCHTFILLLILFKHMGVWGMVISCIVPVFFVNLSSPHQSPFSSWSFEEFELAQQRLNSLFRIGFQSQTRGDVLRLLYPKLVRNSSLSQIL